VEPDRRLTAQGMERKQQLLDRAAELFAERGYAETRVIDIVRAAGVAKGLFYWYFDNKEALFEELAESIRLNLRRTQRQVLEPADAPLRNLRCGTEASVLFMAEHAHFFSLLEVEGRTFTHVLKRGTEQHVGDTLTIIRAGQADGTIRDEDPKPQAPRAGRRGRRRPVLALPPHGPDHDAAARAGRLRRPLRRPRGRRRRGRRAGRAPRPQHRHRRPLTEVYGAPPRRRRPGGAEMAYAFLSDEWLEAAKAIREEYRGKGGAPAHVVRMNQIITEVPFGDGTIEAHMDTSSGELDMDTGHLDNADLTVTLDYATAKAILVEGNPQAGMQAFMAGKIKVQGDMTKLMAMSQGTPDPVQAEIAARIQEITE
jgi:AcrR family transcriptional regulator